MTQVESRLSSPESVGMSANRLERIAPALQKYVDERGYAGFATLVSRRGRLVHAGAAGTAAPGKPIERRYRALFASPGYALI